MVPLTLYTPGPTCVRYCSGHKKTPLASLMDLCLVTQANADCTQSHWGSTRAVFQKAKRSRTFAWNTCIFKVTFPNVLLIERSPGACCKSTSIVDTRTPLVIVDASTLIVCHVSVWWCCSFSCVPYNGVYDCIRYWKCPSPIGQSSCQWNSFSTNVGRVIFVWVVASNDIESSVTSQIQIIETKFKGIIH